MNITSEVPPKIWLTLRKPIRNSSVNISNKFIKLEIKIARNYIYSYKKYL